MSCLNQIFIFCFVAMLCFSSCSKTGPAGPQGEQGEQGPQGQLGEQGIPGADGSTLFSGEGTPSADLGKMGDYYVDKSNSVLYGPKTEDGWGDPLNLKGDKGNPGTANVMYSDWQKFDWNPQNITKYRMTITMNQLTESFMSSGGVVLVYVRINVTPFGHTYYQLPFNFSVLYNCRMEFFIRTGQNQLIFDLFPTSGNMAGQFTGDDYAFRYVLIPGGANLRKASPPDPNDYLATSEYYGITE